jgi:YidC/Oxa1 family membrane protein insertase
MSPEPSDSPLQGRMLLAFLLVFGVIFATPYVYKLISPPAPQPPAPAKKAAAVDTSKPAAAPTPVVAATRHSDATPKTPPSTDQSSAAKEESVVIDTDVYRVIFSNQGAVVKSWTLKKHKDANGKPLELVNPTAVEKVGYPFAYDFRDKIPFDLNKALFVTTPAPDGLSVDFEYSNGAVFAHKSFSFRKSAYVAAVTSEVTQNGTPVLALMQWRGGFGDLAAFNAASQEHEIRYDNSQGKVLRESAKIAKEGPRNTDGSFAFAGLEDQYFALAVLPASNGMVETTIFSDTVPTPFDKEEQPFVGVAAGSAGRASYSLFVGPKEVDILRSVNPKLELIVDWGNFWFIAKPLFAALRWVNDAYVHNYGWSIVLVTIGINMLLFPLKMQNMKSMKKMQALQPQIAVINEKYKNIPMRDPRQQQKNEETMALYKKHGANPLGGCLPLLVQMPFLYAFYTVLGVSMEMRSASWFWVHDLSQPETLAIRILPVLMVLSGFLMQKMTPTAAGVDPAQQKMMAFMPLMMGFFFWKASSGLVLYWLTGNLVGIAQQWFFNKTMTPADTGVINVSASSSRGKNSPAKNTPSRK